MCGLLVPLVSALVVKHEAPPAPSASELGRVAWRGLPSSLVLVSANGIAYGLIRIAADSIAPEHGPRSLSARILLLLIGMFLTIAPLGLPSRPALLALVLALLAHVFFLNRLVKISFDVRSVADDLLTQMYHNSKKPG